MANVKISQLPSATTPLDGTEEIAIVQNNQTVKTTTESIRGGYKMYTALLTQSGGNSDQYISNGDLILGVTYTIINNDDNLANWTNVGAPNNNIGTSFVAIGTTPISWGSSSELNFNTGTPVVVSVLENTLGDIWFGYYADGLYNAFSDSLFTFNKTFILGNSWGDDGGTTRLFSANASSSNQLTFGNGVGENNSNYMCLEIRVYN